MPRESSALRFFCSIAKRGIAVPHGAQVCTDKHAVAARAFWPRKTAENWAAKAGVKSRIAKYWLSGGRRVTEPGKLAIRRYLDE